MKVCSACGTRKSIAAFGKRTRSKDGLEGKCKECSNAVAYAWRAANPAAWQAVRARSYAARGRAQQRVRRYGLSLEDFNSMAATQNQQCAICDKKTALVVDHDHTTGLVRGLLCRACNLGVGHLGDSVAVVQRALEYLKA